MSKEQTEDVHLHPEFWLDTPMQQIYVELQGTVEGLFRPDGMVIDHERRAIYILELTRGMEATERAWRDKEDGKYAAYHATALFLHAQHPWYRIVQGNFVVRVLGSVIESDWHRVLEDIGVDEGHSRRVVEAAVRA